MYLILSRSMILKKPKVVMLMIIFCDEENLFSLKLCQLSLSALSAVAAAGQKEEPGSTATTTTPS